MDPLGLSEDDVRTIAQAPKAKVQFIRSGGQKSVYRVEAGRSTYALKVIDLGDSAARRSSTAMKEARARREVAILSECSCPHLVKAGPLALGVAELNRRRLLYFSEEFIDGEDLASLLQNGARLAAADVAKLGAHIARAIHELADHNKVHRDIKPGNIMRRKSGDYVLLDAGLAFDLHGESLSDGWVVGTVPYFSPEQFDYNTRRQTDFRSDQFSLGVTLFEAATGTHPFWARGVDTSGTLLRKITTDTPQPIEKVVNGFPAELSKTIARMLKKKPHLRYAKCAQLIEALEAGGKQ